MQIQDTESNTKSWDASSGSGGRASLSSTAQETAIQASDAVRPNAERRAHNLGWFSLGLGLLQVAAPGKVARLLGLRDTSKSRTVLTAIGLRELASGVGLLANSRSAGFVWARVAGDAIDLALLGDSLNSRNKSPLRLAAASAAVLGVAAVDTFSALRLSRGHTLQKLAAPIHVVCTITINRTPEEVYRFWRDFQNLPRFMAHLESVRMQGENWVWRAKAPAGLSIEWQAEVTLDRPNEAIAWRSLEGTSVPNRGVVRFKPRSNGRGTELVVELKYDPPGGNVAAAIAKLFGEEPSQQIKSDLRRLKQVLETGDVVHSDASIHRGMHAARPASDKEHTIIVGKVTP